MLTHGQRTKAPPRRGGPQRRKRGQVPGCNLRRMHAIPFLIRASLARAEVDPHDANAAKYLAATRARMRELGMSPGPPGARGGGRVAPGSARSEPTPDQARGASGASGERSGGASGDGGGGPAGPGAPRGSGPGGMRSQGPADAFENGSEGRAVPGQPRGSGSGGMLGASALAGRRPGREGAAAPPRSRAGAAGTHGGAGDAGAAPRGAGSVAGSAAELAAARGGHPAPAPDRLAAAPPAPADAPPLGQGEGAAEQQGRAAPAGAPSLLER